MVIKALHSNTYCSLNIDTRLPVFLGGNIDSIVAKLIRQGYSNVLEWLKEYLINEAEDRELDSEWEDMCVAPPQHEQSVALNTQLFKDLLASIELAPPDNQVL